MRETEIIRPAQGWGINFIQAIREVRANQWQGLKETLDFMAQEFGFENWTESRPWISGRGIDWSSVRGPHAITILKMIAIKHGKRKSGGRK